MAEDDDSVVINPEKLVNKPADTAVNQQRMKSWNPILDPVWAIVTYLILGAIFIPVGFKINSISNQVSEMVVKYDAYDSNDLTGNFNCSIDKANANHNCTITFPPVEKDLEPPILVYYEIDNFFQNHRKYVNSRDDQQLLGSLEQDSVAAKKCDPLNKLGNITLNPCGVIANTLFNDVIQLVGGNDKYGKELRMIEDGIAWQSDIDYKFKQPDGFKQELCDSCDDCKCEGEWTCHKGKPYEKDGKCYRFSYPNDDSTQYLYETYEKIVNPLEGVLNEHFIVWMRTEAVSPFRKLYGHIQQPIKKGEVITFEINANWIVKSFEGSKSLVLTTTEIFGGKSKALGTVFIITGGVLLGLGTLFGLKHFIWPRQLASKKYLRYKED